MTIPTLTDAPDPPLRSEAPATFTAKAEAFVDWQAITFTPEMQAVIDAINALGFSVDSRKTAVRLKTTANHSLSGLADIDGVTPVAGDRILVGSNTAGAENGIYVAASGAWTRATDMDASDEVMGADIFVIAGSTYGGTFWFNTNTTAPTIGTTALTFSQFTGGGSVAAKDDGSTIVATATALNFTGAGVTVTDAGSGQANIAIPGATSVGSWVQIDNQTASTSTEIDFETDFTAYDEYRIELRNVTLSTSLEVAMRLGTGTGPVTYDTGANYDWGARWHYGAAGAGTASGAGQSSKTAIRVGTVASVSPTSSGTPLDISLELIRLQNGEKTAVKEGRSDYDGGGTGNTRVFFNATYNPTTEITGVRIYTASTSDGETASGNFATGSFMLYGRNFS